MSSLLLLLLLGVGMTMGFVISKSIEVEVEVRGRPSWDPPTCSSKYEDCIAEIQKSLAAAVNRDENASNGTTTGSAPPPQKPGFESALLATLNCTKLYLQCRKEMREANKTTTTTARVPVPDANAPGANVF